MYFPPSKKVEQRCCQDAQLEPYLYELSSKFIGPHRIKAEGTSAPMPDQWMDTRNDLLIRKVGNNGHLRKRYQAISREKDKPGISFLMGINPRTGVPYSAINRPEVAMLWMHMHELHQQLGAKRPKSIGASALRISALDAASARLGLLWTIIDETGAALPTDSGVGGQKAALNLNAHIMYFIKFAVKGF